ncbi:hypothetical protein F441_11681 [Phytophthora nicotianae CJ01A1]|uniref:Uncharacterized protein n=4 Tax=Phytophthora nicotianae TaxID=4792 RepID=V9EVL9_PHYNI|nr:hypothetical protein F443_11747 [Phytophthora nicotianae P1569]ETL89913.1 hypothetical protein L917_11234 [Phytophthora nicotianae]ETM43189.1 hypothetical protein L914_11281 [Phytophthora nicotianae]ETO71970.1 hypothetical protein F444_11831 [Phytophthora nicotianae P1976]ETP13102.1 hypothetical protein F441_11681 [Phytophthora nicotianae CJ01A1]
MRLAIQHIMDRLNRSTWAPRTTLTVRFLEKKQLYTPRLPYIKSRRYFYEISL